MLGVGALVGLSSVGRIARSSAGRIVRTSLLPMPTDLAYVVGSEVGFLIGVTVAKAKRVLPSQAGKNGCPSVTLAAWSLCVLHSLGYGNGNHGSISPCTISPRINYLERGEHLMPAENSTLDANKGRRRVTIMLKKMRNSV